MARRRGTGLTRSFPFGSSSREGPGVGLLQFENEFSTTELSVSRGESRRGQFIERAAGEQLPPKEERSANALKTNAVPARRNECPPASA